MQEWVSHDCLEHPVDAGFPLASGEWGVGSWERGEESGGWGVGSGCELVGVTRVSQFLRGWRARMGNNRLAGSEHAAAEVSRGRGRG